MEEPLAKPHSQKIGPLMGIIVILLLLAAGAAYFFMDLKERYEREPIRETINA
jgi:hypothetical protein